MINAVRTMTATLVLLLLTAAIGAQTNNGIEPEALIDQIVTVDRGQREQIRSIVFDAEYLEGKYDDKEGFKQEARLLKKVYLKYLPDTVLFAQEYLEYYENGELKPPGKLQEKAREKEEKARKRKARNISYHMLRPFYPERRDLYDITYEGVAEAPIGELVCHHFRVTAGEEADSLINGDFYFDAESFRLVRADFAPAKLTKKLMFRLKKLDMSITCGPTPEGWWLPRQFEIRGKGKAALLFGVNFAAIEYYRNPQVNVNLSDKLFEEPDDGK